MSFEALLGRLKVKVTLEGHINELFWAITPIYMHGFQNDFAQVFSLKKTGLYMQKEILLSWGLGVKFRLIYGAKKGPNSQNYYVSINLSTNQQNTLVSFALVIKY